MKYEEHDENDGTTTAKLQAGQLIITIANSTRVDIREDISTLTLERLQRLTPVDEGLGTESPEPEPNDHFKYHVGATPPLSVEELTKLLNEGPSEQQLGSSRSNPITLDDDERNEEQQTVDHEIIEVDSDTEENQQANEHEAIEIDSDQDDKDQQANDDETMKANNSDEDEDDGKRHGDASTPPPTANEVDSDAETVILSDRESSEDESEDERDNMSPLPPHAYSPRYSPAPSASDSDDVAENAEERQADEPPRGDQNIPEYENDDNQPLEQEDEEMEIDEIQDEEIRPPAIEDVRNYDPEEEHDRESEYETNDEDSDPELEADAAYYIEQHMQADPEFDPFPDNKQRLKKLMRQHKDHGDDED